MVPERLLPFVTSAPVIHVGPRRPEHRRLVTLGWVSLGSVLAVVGTVQSSVDAQVAPTAPAPHTISAAPAPVASVVRTPFADLMNAEDAWAVGNMPEAARLWMRQGAQAPQDLSRAGWAVRAAVLSQDPALLRQTLLHWNAVRAAMPATLQGQVSELDEHTSAPAVYAAMVDSGAGRAETEADWLKRAPTAAEILSDSEQCAWAPGCTVAPALPWTQLHQLAAQQVQSWKARGFTPQAAWDLYRERQMIGDADHDISSSHQQQLAPIEQLRLAMQKRLARVHTPRDLPAYWASWKEEVPRYGVDLHAPADHVALGGLWAEQVKWTRRLAGKGTGWPAFSAHESHDHWKRLEALVAQDLATAPVGEVPANLTLAAADQRLQAVMQQTGLRQLRWPAVYPNTPDMKWRLASLVQQGNQSLQRATGWEGPVLGQAGHVVLNLVARPAGTEQGVQTALHMGKDAPDNAIISAVLDRNSLGSVAHEWWHAHDFFVGSTPKSSSWASREVAALWHGGVWDPGALTTDVRPVGALWDQLNHAPLSAEQTQEAVLEGWVGRWSYVAPLDRARWLAEAADVRGHRHSPEGSQMRWLETPTVALQELHDSLSPALPANESLARPHTPAHWLQQPGTQASRSENLQSTYWGAPPEVLARAFERQLADERLFASDSPRVWLYYPQGMEKAWQTGVWHQYFKEQATWWQQWRNHVTPEAPTRTLGQAIRLPPSRR